MTKTPTTEYKELLREYSSDPRIQELFSYTVKLERIAEVAGQYKESLEDRYATAGEQEYALTRLEEVYEEYEMYLDNFKVAS